MKCVARFLTAVCALLALAACGPGSEPDTARAAPDGVPEVVVRVGHFPNVTHAHGLVAHALTRAERGWFEERLGPGTRVEWFTYNAGPSAMEALLAGSIDLAYVGPNPAINAHVKSRGADVRVLAGATRGGAALVVQGDGRIAGPADFRGRRVGTPQFGNTQDVAARAWLRGHGHTVTMTGGDVTVIPTANPDQLALFRTGDLDAVWTVEPWVSRLETEAGGKVLVEETDALTTLLVGSARFVREQRDTAGRFVQAHEELTRWMVAHPDEAQGLLREELRAETRTEMAPDLLRRCWSRMQFSSRIAVPDFVSFLRSAQAAGFLKDAGDPDAALGRLVEVLE